MADVTSSETLAPVFTAPKRPISTPRAGAVCQVTAVSLQAEVVRVTMPPAGAPSVTVSHRSALVTTPWPTADTVKRRRESIAGVASTRSGWVTRLEPARVESMRVVASAGVTSGDAAAREGLNGWGVATTTQKVAATSHQRANEWTVRIGLCRPGG